MFEKIVAVDPVVLEEKGREALKGIAREVVFFTDYPQSQAEVARRIGDADAALVSFQTPLRAEALRQCPRLTYIGMCCSLYNPESANVDILTARELGITVKGVLDYGDEGVPEYVISELVRFLHGFGGAMWCKGPSELKGLETGILGMGTTGNYVGRALRFFGAGVSYYSRTRKPGLEQVEGYRYACLDEVLSRADILVTCLNRNTVLLGKEQFARFGDGKILVNISIGPGHDAAALAAWLQNPDNHVFADTPAAVDPSGQLLALPNVHVVGQSAGYTRQAMVRLGEKVLQNILDYFAGQV